MANAPINVNLRPQPTPDIREIMIKGCKVLNWN